MTPGGMSKRAPGGWLWARSFEGSSFDHYSIRVAFSEETVAEKFTSQNRSFR